MPRVPAELLQKIKDAVNLVDIAGEHIVLRKSGSNYGGLCPFHSERSPSFSVSEAKQVYHCYGCKAGGDVVTFVMQMHGLSFPEAIQELAERGKVALPTSVFGDDDGGDPEVAKRRQAEREKLSLAYRLNRFAAAFYRKQFEKGDVPSAVHYARERGVSQEWEKTFYLGAAVPGWDALARQLQASKAPLDLAVGLGLIRPSPKGVAPGGVGHFDLFRNRLMFPILDLRGKVAGFGGRQLPGSDHSTDKESPKYLNSPESLLFHKSKLAFGLFQAHKHIREQDEVVLVEGYFDVIALHRAGFQNTVATCGTSLSADHLKIFKRFSSRITLLFDGDRAGQQAMERAMVTALEQGAVVYGAFLPRGLDPDELVGQGKDGVSELQGLISKAVPLLDLKITEAVKEAEQGPEQRVQALKRISSWLAAFTDPVGKQVRIEALSKTIGMSRELVDASLREAESAAGGRRPAPGATSRPQPASVVSIPTPRPFRSRAPAAPKLAPQEKSLLVALVNWPQVSEIFSEFRSLFPPEMTFSDLFEYPEARKVALRVFDPSLLEKGSLSLLTHSPQSLLEGVEDSQVRSTISEALVAMDPLISHEEVRRALQTRLARLWARFSQRIKAALTDAEARNDADLHSRLMQDYLDVQRKIKEFNTFYDKAE